MARKTKRKTSEEAPRETQRETIDLAKLTRRESPDDVEIEVAFIVPGAERRAFRTLCAQEQEIAAVTEILMRPYRSQLVGIVDEKRRFIERWRKKAGIVEPGNVRYDIETGEIRLIRFSVAPEIEI